MKHVPKDTIFCDEIAKNGEDENNGDARVAD